MVKVGLVGVGKMGLSHFAILGAHPDVEIAAVCDSAGYLTSALKKNAGVTTFKDANSMFAKTSMDAVFISTPNSTHYELANKALDLGLHVFVEKPLCLRPEESRRLAEKAEGKNLVNQVGYHNRFIGTFREARRIVQAGGLGNVHHVDGRAFGQVVIKPKTGGTWRAKKTEGGGCLHDYSCHVLDLMNFVAGSPSAVVSSQLQSIFSSEIEDAVYATMTYPSGATGYLETNWSDEAYRKMSTTLTVYGTNGKLIADRQELRVFLKPGAAFESYDEGWTIKYITGLQEQVNFYLRGEEYSAQIDQFISDVMAGKGSVEYSFSSAAMTDSVIDEIASKGKVR